MRSEGTNVATTARRRSAGFTLIELMIVVAIVGILAVLASYGVSKLLASSKTAEATNAIGRIAKDALTAYEGEGMAASVLAQKNSASLSCRFCGGASQTVPASQTSIAGRKYQSKLSDWTVDSVGNSGFACLKFEMDSPQYYMYSYGISGTGAAGDSFTAQAQGDLNADGVLSLFQLQGKVSSSMVLNLAPHMLVVREED